jgi:predicted DNA-binding transcriptional regulator AlpA
MALYPPRDDISRDDAHQESALGDFPNRFLNVQEAARFLGLSVSTLNKLRLSGSGPPYMKLGRRVLYDLRDLASWAAARKRQHTSEQL